MQSQLLSESLTKPRQANRLLPLKRRPWRHLLLIAVSGSALIATPHLASAQITEDSPGSGEYTASGELNGSQSVVGNNAKITTTPGFSVTASDGDALDISGSGALEYTDTNSSALVANAAGRGLDIFSTGDDNGVPGSVKATTNGTITGTDGVYARTNGTGGIEITTHGVVTGTAGHGIFGAVMSGGANGALTITATQAVSGTRSAITASSLASNGIEISTVGATGGENGIIASNANGGSINITATGTVEGTTEDGIFAINESGTSDVTIKAHAVTGGVSGIVVENKGTGDTSITTTGAVSGTGERGISVSNSSPNGKVTVTAEAKVQGGGAGIVVFQEGNGEVTVDTVDVTGGDEGIFIANTGTGDVKVTSTGVVEGTESRGILVTAGSGSGDVTIKANQVTGGSVGIFVENLGEGDVEITTTGIVTGTGDRGIHAYNVFESTGSLIINAGAAVTGTTDGIFAENYGDGVTQVTATDVTGSIGIYAQSYSVGGLTVKATGKVTGTIANGVNAHNNGEGAGLTVELNEVTGKTSGLIATNSSVGETKITTTGEVIGQGGHGIRATNRSTAGALSIDAKAAVTGSVNGILVLNEGDGGNTTIKAAGKVKGESASGIDATNTATAGALTIEANEVEGSEAGIVAVNNGDGDTKVEVQNATGGNYGINVQNFASGDLFVDATGTVAGTNGVGIHAANNTDTGDLEVKANAVTGGNFGINAVNDGNGDTKVETSGKVTGTTAQGVNLDNAATAGALTFIATDTVSGGTVAVDVANLGDGDTNVTVKDATGGQAGIVVENRQAGDAKITSTGTVSGTTLAGIAAQNFAETGDLTIDANVVTGGQYGVIALNEGSGDTVIKTSGKVTGTSVDGIQVENTATSGALKVTATDDVVGTVSGINVTNMGKGNTEITLKNASGGEVGVYAANDQSGDLKVTSTGTVTGTTFAGIYAVNVTGAGDVIVEANAASGAAYGVFATNYGAGDTSIVANGIVQATVLPVSGTSAAIAAYNGNQDSQGKLSVEVGANGQATGGHFGIATDNLGSGGTTIKVDGLAQGSLTAIAAIADEDQTIGIDISGVVRNSSQNSADMAILTQGGVVTLNNSGLVVGRVSLADQGNRFNNSDTWNAAGGYSIVGGILDNRSEGVVSGANTDGTAAETTIDGTSTVIHSGHLVLQNQLLGASSNALIAIAPSTVVGDVMTFSNEGSGQFQSNSGRLYLDTDLESGTSDRLVVDNVMVQSGPTVVFVNGIGTGRATSDDGIEVVDVQGTSANNAFVLSGPVRAGLFNYSLGQGSSDTQSWFLQSGLRDEAVAVNALSVLGSRTALSTLPGMHDRLREDQADAELYGSRSGARLVSRDLTLPEARETATKGVWGRVFGENNKFQSDGGSKSGYDTKLWGAQVGLDLHAQGSEAGGRQYAGIYIGHASSSGDALSGSSRIGSLNVDATTVGAYFTSYAASGWYVDAAAQYSKLGGVRLRTADSTLRPDGSGYAVSLEGGKQINRNGKLNTQVQAQLIYQKTDVDDVTLSDSTRLDIGSLSAVTGRVGVRLSQNPQYAGRFQPWLRANLWHTFNKDAQVSSQGASSHTPIGGTTGEVQVGFALTPSKAGGWSAYVAGGYLFDLSGSEYSGWKGIVGVRKGW